MAQKKRGKEIPRHLRQFTQEDRIAVIADFGVRLIKRVFGGRRLHHHHLIGDIFHKGFGYYLDAKMTGSNSSIRIPETQLVKHYEPDTEHGHAYAFVMYNNLDKNHSAQINRVVKGQKGLVRFLASRSKQVFLIDTTILIALYEKLGARTYRLKGGYHQKMRPRQPCVAVRRKVLKAIVQGDELVLSELGIERSSYQFSSRSLKIRLEGHKVELTVHKVILKKEAVDDSFDPDSFDLPKDVQRV